MNEQNTPVQPSNQNSAIDRKLQSDKKYYWFLVMYMVLESALGSFVQRYVLSGSPGNVPILRMYSAAWTDGVDDGHDRARPRATYSWPYQRPVRTAKPVLVGSLILFVVALS